MPTGTTYAKSLLLSVQKRWPVILHVFLSVLLTEMTANPFFSLSSFESFLFSCLTAFFHYSYLVGIFIICAVTLITIGYIVFKAKNTGRCVDLKNGIEFNTSFIRTRSACNDYGFAWVYEPFYDEDPRRRYDPLVFHRERILEQLGATG